jgi:DNA-binding CsgD family transcriptional regulator
MREAGAEAALTKAFGTGQGRSGAGKVVVYWRYQSTSRIYILTMAKDPSATPPSELTEREQEILKLLATGTSNKEIARQLFISTNTVKVHIRNIFGKIGTASRTEAAMYAVRLGLVERPALEMIEEAAQGGQAGTIDMTPKGETAMNATDTIKVRPKLRAFYITAIVLGLAALGLIGYTLAGQPGRTPGTPIYAPTVTQQPRWHELTAVTTAREGMAVSAYGNEIYAIGGETADGISGEVEQYDTSKDTWSALQQKPVAVADAQAAVLGGKIYVPGGRTGAESVSKALEIYDPHLDSWTRGTDLPFGLSGYALVTFEGRLYLFGGWDGTKYLDKVLMYQPDSQKWTEGKPLKTKRGFAGAVVVEGKVYVIGGQNETGEVAVNETNDLNLEAGGTNDWQTELPLPVPAMGVHLINVVDLVYAVVSEEGTNGLYIFHNQAGEVKNWEFVAMPFEFSPRFAAVMAGSRLYILGENVANENQALNVAYDAVFTIMLPITK